MSKKRTNKKWSKNKKGGSNKETSRLTRTNDSKKSNHARFSPYISETKFFDIQTPESSISNASPLDEEAVDSIKTKFSDTISKNKITNIDTLNMLKASLHDQLSKAYDEKNNKKKYKYKILPTREELQQEHYEFQKLIKKKRGRASEIKKYRKNLLDIKKAEEANKEYQEQLNKIPDKLRKTKKNRDRDTIIGNPTKSRKRFYFFN